MSWPDGKCLQPLRDWYPAEVVTRKGSEWAGCKLRCAFPCLLVSTNHKGKLPNVPRTTSTSGSAWGLMGGMRKDSRGGTGGSRDRCLVPCLSMSVCSFVSRLAVEPTADR